MRKPITLTAAANDLSTVQLTAGLDLTASVAERTITGTICEYGAVGYTSAGPTIFMAGSLTPPSPVTKAKLLVQHDQSSAAVGIMASFTDDATHPKASFSIPAGDEGDDALTKAANGLRDGLSVGVHLDAYYWDGDDNLVVTAARMFEVSLVTIPAFENAGVTSVAAANQRGITMNRAQLAAALAAGTITQAEHDTQLAALEAAQPTPPAAPAAPAAVEPVLDLRGERQAPPPAPLSANDRGLDLRAAAQRTIEHLQGGGSAATLAAALSDTVQTGDTGQAYLGRPTFINEVWTASSQRRPLIDAIGSKPLEGDRAEGYQWGVKPTVPQYAGGKAAIHSEALTWVPVSVDAVPFAGGWDIERKFIDLGRTGLIEDTYQKATDDYRLKTEAYVETTITAAATNAGAKASLVALLTDLGATALGTGFNIDFVQLAPALFSEFVNLDEDDVPWWLKNQGEINLGTSEGTAGGIKFSVGTFLATRGWLAGDKRAATYYEVDPPIRVQAENIPQGGIDLGVFGYAALLVNDARALLKGTVTAPA